MAKTALLCVSALCVVGLVRAEMYTGLLQFTQVLHSEDVLAARLEEYIQAEEQRINYLKQIAADYHSHSQQSLGNVEDYLGNPLNAFLLIKRFTSDWNKVVNIIQNQDASQEFINNVTASVSVFPNEHDLVGSGRALLRLQDTYALDTKQVAMGNIQGAADVQKLTGDDCFELGRIAYDYGDYYHAVLWFQQALELFKEEDADSLVIGSTLDYLAFSVYSQGNIQAAMNLTHEWLTYDPENQRAKNNLLGYARDLRSSVNDDPAVLKNKRVLSGFRATEDFLKYERLCRGEKVMENPWESQLTCFYNKEHPYFWLRPLKQEVKYMDPPVYVFHDLITDTEIQMIKELATPMLHTSMLFKHTDPNHKQTDDVRVSQSAWIRDEYHPLVERLSQKVQFAVGLSVKEAEAMQVLNYGIGGHYEPHHDWAKPEEDRSDLPDFRDFGNRISTSLYYMTDVPAGGYTVFTDIGVAVPPEKGSMLHWYNLHKSGDGDWRTKHAGCPVLTGTKWVCNKWIHERGQEFRRPCALNPHE